MGSELKHCPRTESQILNINCFSSFLFLCVSLLYFKFRKSQMKKRQKVPF